MRLKAVLSCLFLANVCLAQQSTSYKLTEQTFNAGGHPANGVVMTSPSHRVRLDAIGEVVAGTGLSAASFHLNGGFTSAYPPPGEVAGLRFVGTTTLAWSPEPSAGTYNLYRDLLSTLSGRTYGACQQSSLASETATDTGTPPVGNGWFYLVTAENRLSEEGTKGQDAAGAERPNAYPCP
jgi:hypothetical protein